MRDHARRFRLRALMAGEISHGPISVGDLVHRLDTLMDKDDNLSMALLPELWAVAASSSGNAAWPASLAIIGCRWQWSASSCALR